MSAFANVVLVGLLAFSSQVAAHGDVTRFVCRSPDGKQSEHKGARYGAVTNYDSAGWAIPQVLDAGFVRPSTYATPDIICHKGAINGKETVQIKAGSAVDIFWETWPKDHIGPVINYLANCHGPCEKVDKTKLEFCKIDEAGLIGTKPNRWATNKFFDDGFKWTVTIPEDTLPGNYVLRHELINIKGNTERDGAQHYPQCINFEVVGNGTTVLPGVPGMQLYKPTDPGVTKDFNKQVDSYPIPGPPVFKSGSGSAQAPGSYDAKPASSSTAASSGTAAPEAYEAPQAYDAGVKAADAKPSGAQTSKPAAAASGDKAQCAQTATVTVTVTATSSKTPSSTAKTSAKTSAKAAETFKPEDNQPEQYDAQPNWYRHRAHRH